MICINVFYKFRNLAVVLSIVFSSCQPKQPSQDFDAGVKVALREVGNELLNAQQDSTSLVLPVLKKETSVYQLSFENNMAFDPAILSSAIANSFSKANIAKDYRVEVEDCKTKEIAYSYLMQLGDVDTIIPCMGRVAPKKCYTIQVVFIKTTPSRSFKSKFLFYTLVILVLAFLGIVFLSRYYDYKRNDETVGAFYLGSFQFYPDQNKLIKAAIEITLTKKETELLEIFVANPNQVIKREELTKKVWEDNGVIVGRSLDTYISKLRKKLQEDESIRLTNIHGVGYKLEI